MAVKNFTDTSEFKAAQLAPLEELEAQHLTDTIRMNAGGLNLPKQFLGVETEPARTFRPHGVVVAILGLLLAFVAFIAYLISQMPVPAN